MIAMVRKRCEFMCPLNRVFGLFGLCHFFLEVAVQHKGGNTTKNANAPQIWPLGLQFGYTTISHTSIPHLLHFSYTTLVIKNAPHLLHFGYTFLVHTCYTFTTQHWYSKMRHFCYTLATQPFPTLPFHTCYTFPTQHW